MTGVAAILRFPLADIDENRVTEETVAEAAGITVDKLTSTLTTSSIQDNNEDNNQKKVLKKVETAASNTPNKKAQKPTQKVNTSKKGSKYDFGEEDNYDEYDDYY